MVTPVILTPDNINNYVDKPIHMISSRSVVIIRMGSVNDALDLVVVDY